METPSIVPNQDSMAATRRFDELAKAEQTIYLKNTLSASRLAPGTIGDLLVTLTDPITKSSMTLAIPKNSIICATEQCNFETLRVSNDIRKFIRNNAIQVLDQKDFDRLCVEDPKLIEKSYRELSRLMASVNLENNPNLQDQAAAVSELVGDYDVRPAVNAILTQAQIEQGDEEDLLVDLKSLAPFAPGEIAFIRGILPSIPATYNAIARYIQTL
jgi:hypothetical protein